MKIYNDVVKAICGCCKREDLECKPVIYGDNELVFLCGECLVFLENFLEAVDIKIAEL